MFFGMKNADFQWKNKMLLSVDLKLEGKCQLEQFSVPLMFVKAN